MGNILKLPKNILIGGFLVLAIPLTVFVAQQATERRQRASEVVVFPTPTPTPSIFSPYKISGNVFHDKNGDTQMQTGEGVGNVPIKITNESEQQALTLTTDSNGHYQAVISEAGAYLVAGGVIEGYTYVSTNPKVLHVKGICPTVTPPPPSDTETPLPSNTPLPTATPSPTSVPTLEPTIIPSNTPTPFLTVVPDTDSSSSGNVQGVSDVSCNFTFTANFVLAAKPNATTIPTPTIDACRVGLTNINVHTYCGNNQYRFVDFQCANGASGKLGGDTTCKTMDSWYGYARNSCMRQSSCPVTPTTRPTVLPSATSVPTATPTTRPTNTPAPTATPFPQRACDINGNGKLGVEDFNKLVSCFRSNDCGKNDRTRADLNKDGKVTFTDLNIFFKFCKVPTR